MRKETFKIEEMHYLSCGLTIEKALSKIPGIKTCQVNFPLGQALLEYDEEKITLSEIKKEIQKLGYDLIISPEKAPQILAGKIKKGQEKGFVVNA